MVGDGRECEVTDAVFGGIVKHDIRAFQRRNHCVVYRDWKVLSDDGNERGCLGSNLGGRGDREDAREMCGRGCETVREKKPCAAVVGSQKGPKR